MLCLFAVGGGALRDVRVIVPADVRHTEDATLQCLFDLEGDVLYSVKWYKGQHEFYRFTPKEEPSMKVFPLQGLKVDVSTFHHNFFTFENPLFAIYSSF
jgi:hypothetical protein